MSPSLFGRKYCTFCCSSKMSMLGQCVFMLELPLKFSTEDQLVECDPL